MPIIQLAELAVKRFCCLSAEISVSRSSRLLTVFVMLAYRFSGCAKWNSVVGVGGLQKIFANRGIFENMVSRVKNCGKRCLLKMVNAAFHVVDNWDRGNVFPSQRSEYPLPPQLPNR